MKRFFLFAPYLLLVAGASHGEQPDDQTSPITIPLSEVVGLGERGLRELEPDLLIYRDTPEKIEKYSTPEGMEEARRLAAKSLVVPIERAMGKMRRAKNGATSPGFVVRGKGRSALPGIYNVLVEGESPQNQFRTGEQLTLVFFVVPSIPVKLLEIKRAGATISIRYALIHSGLPSLPWHLSLIPLGDLPSGQYHVEMVRATDKERNLVRPDFPLIAKGTESQIVCHPFEFDVVEEQSNSTEVQDEEAIGVQHRPDSDTTDGSISQREQ